MKAPVICRQTPKYQFHYSGILEADTTKKRCFDKHKNAYELEKPLADNGTLLQSVGSLQKIDLTSHKVPPLLSHVSVQKTQVNPLPPPPLFSYKLGGVILDSSVIDWHQGGGRQLNLEKNTPTQLSSIF